MLFEKNMFKLLYHTCWKKIDEDGYQKLIIQTNRTNAGRNCDLHPGEGGGGGGCEGYGFQADYSRIGYINQSVWV